MKDEIWKDVKDLEDRYEISNKCRIRSKDRLSKDGKKIIKGKILKPSIRKGYYRIKLGGKQRTIHQMVAESFLGHIRCGMEKVVDHIDNNKLNNNVENLQIITNRKNCSKDKKSKHTGVREIYRKRKGVGYVASIYIEKNIHLGIFDNEEDAIYAYQEALRKLKKK